MPEDKADKNIYETIRVKASLKAKVLDLQEQLRKERGRKVSASELIGEALESWLFGAKLHPENILNRNPRETIDAAANINSDPEKQPNAGIAIHSEPQDTSSLSAKILGEVLALKEEVRKVLELHPPSRANVVDVGEESADSDGADAAMAEAIGVLTAAQRDRRETARRKERNRRRDTGAAGHEGETDRTDKKDREAS